jgi:ParB/RepB/Spo0J family partition protein
VSPSNPSKERFISEITELRVEQIHAGHNPRSHFDDDSLTELAGSIAQDGVLDPVRVVANQDGYRLESGERRFRAAKLAGLQTIPAIIVAGNHTDELVRALVTNVQRQDMNVVDEARAYHTLFKKHGLTMTGIAERLGVAQSRVTQRLELLELPGPLLQLYYDGQLRLDCRRVFRDIGMVSAALVGKTVAGKDEWGAVLAKEPMRVLGYVAKEAKPGTYFLLPGRFDRKELKLRKAQEERAAKQDTEYSTWSPTYEPSDLELAATTGVAYTHKDATSGVVVSREWMRDHFDVVLARRAAEIERRKAEQAKLDAEVKKAKLTTGDVAPENTENEERLKEFRSAERQALADGRVAARAANLELGRALLNELAAVDVGKLSADQARVVAYGLVGARLGDLFLAGLRYCLPEYQTEVKVGKNGDRTKIEYVTGKTEAIRKAREWLLRADKPAEIVGRALILVLAASYADQGCVAQSDRLHPGIGGWDAGSWGADQGGEVKGLGLAKAVEQLAKTVVPSELRAKTKPSEKPVVAIRRKYQDLTADPQGAARRTGDS